MKQLEDLHKVVKELVDLTKCEDNNTGDQLSEEDSIKMPELALVMAKYFTSLGKYCLSVYNSYNKKQKTQEYQKSIAQDGKANAPAKKPQTAYIRYYKQQLPIFHQKYPGYSIPELTSLISKSWKNLTGEEKQQYIIQAQDYIKPQEQVLEKCQYRAKLQLKSRTPIQQFQYFKNDSEIGFVQEKMEVKQKQQQIAEHKEN